MTNVVGVKQLLATVQETLSQFHSLRDQKHHNTYTKLKQYIKSNNYNWQKYYINQTVHEILFNTIIKCYEKVNEFKQNMFGVIANELNMYYTLKNNNISNECINSEINKILSNRFGSYFKDIGAHLFGLSYVKHLPIAVCNICLDIERTNELYIDQLLWCYVLSNNEAHLFANNFEYSVPKATDVSPDHPVVISQFVLGAKGIEFDAVARHAKLLNYATPEHVENADVHSGDVTLILQAENSYTETTKTTKNISKKIAGAFHIIQFHVKITIKVIDINRKHYWSALPSVLENYSG